MKVYGKSKDPYFNPETGQVFEICEYSLTIGPNENRTRTFRVSKAVWSKYREGQVLNDDDVLLIKKRESDEKVAYAHDARLRQEAMNRRHKMWLNLIIVLSVIFCLALGYLAARGGA